MIGRKTRPAAGLSTAIVCLSLGMATSARAEIERDPIAGTVEFQSVVTQRMAAEAVLVVLDIDRDSNLVRLIQSREQFDRTLRAFREEGSDSAARVVGDPEVYARVEQAEKLWAEMDAAVAQCLTFETATAEHIGDVAEYSESLQDAVGALAEGLRLQTTDMSAHSMLGKAIETTIQTQALAQQMTKEYLLVAYGHQPGRYRFALRDTAERFELRLTGLLLGDFDRQLLPAPTPEIQSQLQRVERIWREDYRPIVDSAADSEVPDAAVVARLARINLQLLQEIESATEMYNEL